MKKNTDSSASGARRGPNFQADIERTARIAGLRDFHTPTLEAVEKRRLQLWITALLLLVSVSVVLVFITLGLSQFESDWFRPELLQIALLLLVFLFSGYALEKEMQLRRLTKLLVSERVLTASLTNRLREISFLLKAGKALNLNLDLQGVLDTISRCAHDLLECRESSIMMVQADDQLRGVTGNTNHTVRFGEGLAGRVANSREPLLASETLTDATGNPLESSSNTMCVPLIHRETLLGVLQVDATVEHPYTQHDLRALSLFAEQAASAIANAQLYEEQRLTASRSAYQALHDTLTTLPNRFYFLDHLEQGISRQRQGGKRVALLFVDVDDFKSINDNLGHFAGDEVLVELGRRMRSCLRTTDTAARLGGDEFAIMIEGIRSSADVARTAERLHKKLSEPYVTSVREKTVKLTISVGIALEGLESKTGTDLLRNANTAMRIAKRSGKARTVVFKQNLDADTRDHSDLEAELWRALEREEFELAFQPIFSLDSGRITALEALIRWRHPKRGMLPAGAFVPIAEQSGSISDIDRWVFDEACRTLQELTVPRNDWSLDLHLNVLPSRLSDPKITADLQNAIQTSGIQPKRVVLEVSESAAFTAINDSRSVMHTFKSLGVRLALDDFGTGYSSLTYLNRFPVDVIKIHPLFVSGLTEAAVETDLAKAIVSLGLSLNLSVIAQGVERTDQLMRLREMKCPYAQGAILSEPIPLTSLEQLLRSPDPVPSLRAQLSTVA
jgi:diguanylate cyclase (GGDEF)-like protein